MRERILNDLKTAMKNQDKVTLSVIRMVKGSMQLLEIDLHRELNDDEVIGVISKEIKTRKDSVKEFERGNRQDLVDATNNEIKILEAYLPEQLTEEELDNIITDVFSKINPTGMQDMGKIMGMISPLVKGKADMGIVSSKIRERLSK